MSSLVTDQFFRFWVLLQQVPIDAFVGVSSEGANEAGVGFLGARTGHTLRFGVERVRPDGLLVDVEHEEEASRQQQQADDPLSQRHPGRHLPHSRPRRHHGHSNTVGQ